MAFGATNGHSNGNGHGSGGVEDYTPLWPMVPGTAKVSVTINGTEVQAEEGQTILQACRVLGIDVPTLCYEPKLAPYGACRICVVEVEGRGRHPDLVRHHHRAEGMVITTHSDRLIENRRMVLELIFSDHDAYCLPPCQFKCPTRVDIPGYLKQNSLGNWEEATRILKRSLPFPAILGRVCPAPCETHCRREEVDTAIAIRDSHRYCADRVLEVDAPAPIPWPKEPDTGRRVAVIGAGPAGMSAAYYLQLRGHHCDVFEAEPEQGGMLRYGIPEYRLPKAWMDRELNHVWELGATLQAEHAPRPRLPRRRPAGAGLRRGLRRHRLLQVERAGDPRRGRRRGRQRPREPLQLDPRRRRSRRLKGRAGGRHRRRLHRHRLHADERPPGRRRGDPRLPPRPEGHAGPGRGARGDRGGGAGHLPGRADPHRDRQAQQGHRRRVPAHEARRAGREGSPPSGADARHRVRRRAATPSSAPSARVPSSPGSRAEPEEIRSQLVVSRRGTLESRGRTSSAPACRRSSPPATSAPAPPPWSRRSARGGAPATRSTTGCAATTSTTRRCAASSPSRSPTS